MGGYDRGVAGRFVIRSTCDGKFGQSGDTYGWGVGGGNYGTWVCLWGNDRFGWRELRPRDLRFEVSTRKTQGCDDGSRSVVSLVRWFGLPSREYRWRRETFPPTLSQLDYLLKNTGYPDGSISLRRTPRTGISPFVPPLGLRRG